MTEIAMRIVIGVAGFIAGALTVILAVWACLEPIV